MSAECDALRAELARIRADIAALDNRFIPRPDRAAIIEDARQLILPLMPAIALGVVRPEINGLRGAINLASTKASQALGLGQNALSSAESASLRAAIARTQAAEGIAKATAAQTTGDLAQELGRRASLEASVSKTLANRASGVAASASSAAAQATTKATTAARSAANAIGISNTALSKAGQALAGLGRVFGIINIILGVIAAFTFAAQLAQLASRISFIENVLNTAFDPIYRLIGVNRAEIRRVQEHSNSVANAAARAQATANTADNRATNAGNAAANALSFALNAFGLASSLLFLRSLVPSIARTASTAQATADAAMRRVLTPGARGLPGLAGQRGLTGQRGPAGEHGRNGLPGLPGAAGAPGQQGRRGLQGVPGLQGPRGLQGLRGFRGAAGAPALENPMNEQLLRKIDATTTANLATSRGNQALSTAIQTRVQAAQAFAVKAWESTRLQKIMNLLTLMSVLHNAAFLSRNVAQTLGDVLSNGLAIADIKDEKGDRIDVNEAVGTSASNWLKSLVGEDVYTSTRISWLKLMRVYQSAANIVFTMRSIFDSTQEVVEFTAENTGKIGNALKKAGVVFEGAYKWMPEKVQAQDAVRRKWQRVIDGIDNVDDAASSLQNVTGEVLDIREEFAEIQTARAEATAAIRDLTPNPREDNVPVATAVGEAKAESDGPEVPSADLEPDE